MGHDSRGDDVHLLTGTLAGDLREVERDDLTARVIKENVRAKLFRHASGRVKIARFTLLERVGAGAMGEVYAAYDEQLDRKVAIKLVRPDAASHARRARPRERLLREAQTLAQLSHPNVVQIYDAGEVDGQVYVAMEFIRGVTLREWVADLDASGGDGEQREQRERPRWRAILEVFVAAGRGLAAAHAAGLTHRDFKPDNVLVSDDGRVRVVDFGLARPEIAPVRPEIAPVRPAASPASPPASGTDLLDTVADEPVTKEFIAAGNADALTLSLRPDDEPPADSARSRRADLAADDAGDHLGDRDALDALALQAALDDDASFERVRVLDTERLTASGAVMGTPAYMAPEQIEGRAADRRSDVFSFCVALYEALYGKRPYQGEGLIDLLDSIIEGPAPAPSRGAGVPAWVWTALRRGLAADPDQRYPDMDELLRALSPERRAVPARWLAAGLLAAGVALGGGLVFAVSPAQQAAAVCDAASDLDAVWSPGARERASAAFAATRLPYADSAWTSAEAELDRYAAAWAGQQRQICADRARDGLGEDGAVLRRLCLGRRLQSLRALIQQFERADAGTVERAVAAVAELPDLATCSNAGALALSVREPDSPEQAARAAATRELLAEALALELAGHYRDGLERALAAARQADRDGYAPVRAEAMFRAGRLYAWRGERGDADRGIALMLEAVGLAEASRHDELAATAWNALTNAAQRQDVDMARARAWSQRAVAASSRLGSARERATALRVLGVIDYNDGRFARAEERQREALALAEQHGLHPLIIAGCLHALGNTLQALSETDEARAVFDRALAHYRDELGAEHPRIARPSYDFGLFLAASGEFERARVLLEQALAVWERVHGPEHRDVGSAHMALGAVAVQRGDLPAASFHAERAHALAARGDDDEASGDGSDRIEAEMLMGVVKLRRARHDEALASFRAAEAIQRRVVGDDHWTLAIPLANVCEALVAMGRHDDALATLEQAARVTAGTELPAALTGPMAKCRGQALLGKGRARAAVTALEQAAAILAAQPGLDLERADASWALARALDTAGGDDGQTRARALARAAQRIYDAHGAGWAASSEAIARWLADRE